MSTIDFLINNFKQEAEELLLDELFFLEDYTKQDCVLDMVTVMEDAVILHEGEGDELIEELKNIFKLFTTTR